MGAKKEKQDLEAEVWNAITAFEQILEAMPTDRASLEALSHAYEQIGDLTKAKEYFVRLANVLLEEGDYDSARALLVRLAPFAAEDDDVLGLMSQIEAVSGGAVVESAIDEAVSLPEENLFVSEKPKARKDVSVSTAFNMSEELAMAWNLMEANEITQEEYASVVQDLTEMSTGDSVATISVLHVLEARGFKTLDRIIAYLVEQCSTPFVSLSSFDLTSDPAVLLPIDFVVRRGALVFELLGHDALVVVMNPFDKQLRKDVELLADRRCHFYLTIPSEFDRAAEKAAEKITALKEEQGLT